LIHDTPLLCDERADIMRTIAEICELAVAACTTRMLHDSVDHEDSSNGVECRSCGGFIDASRRRCRAMAVMATMERRWRTSRRGTMELAAATDTGRRPKHVCTPQSIVHFRYKLLGRVTALDRV